MCVCGGVGVKLGPLQANLLSFIIVLSKVNEIFPIKCDMNEKLLP